MSKEICHVCKKEKKPYIVFLNDNMLSYMNYERAREDGPICERCSGFFAMTGEFKDATDEEFELAKESCKFARAMKRWWEKDSKIDVDGDNSREWGGTAFLSEWYRKEFKDGR